MTVSLTRRSYRTPSRNVAAKRKPTLHKGNGYRRHTSRIKDWIGAARTGGMLLVTVCALVVVVAGLSWMVLAGHRLVTTHPYFGLRHVEVSGNNRISVGQVMEVAGLQLGQNTLSLDMAEVRDSLLGEPWIAQVTVKRVLPDRLAVRLTEREASFLVKSGKALHYASCDGRIIAPVEAGRFVSLPVLNPEEGVAPESLSVLVRSIEEKRMPFSMAEVAWIRATAGGEAVIGLTRSLVVSLELSGLEENIRRMNLAWRDLEFRGGIGAVAGMTVFGGKVLAKIRPQAKEADGRIG
jgi:cell division protein FtsQ